MDGSTLSVAGPSPSPEVCPSSCPLNQWCHPTISFSVTLFSFCLHYFPGSGSIPISWLFALGGQSIGSTQYIEHELLIVKFRLKLKNMGKTTRAFKYDINKIPYDCTVEETNRFKELECLKNCGQRCITLYWRLWSKPSPRKRKAKRQNGSLRRPYNQLRKEEKWKAKEKRKDIPIWMQSSKE